MFLHQVNLYVRELKKPTDWSNNTTVYHHFCFLWNQISSVTALSACSGYGTYRNWVGTGYIFRTTQGWSLMWWCVWNKWSCWIFSGWMFQLQKSQLGVLLVWNVSRSTLMFRILRPGLRPHLKPANQVMLSFCFIRNYIFKKSFWQVYICPEAHYMEGWNWHN